MIILENNVLKASIHLKGAELQSLYHKRHELEYIWQGDPTFWAKHSPVLFPIVGGLKNNEYIFEGKVYNLPRHGFARDKQFELETQSEHSVTLLLKADEGTLANYPFDFELRLIYTLTKESLDLVYDVRNKSDKPMYFSIGAHPAFNLPLVKGTDYNDYCLKFEQEECSARYTLKNNLISQPVPYLQNQTILNLKPELFYEDAIVFKDLRSEKISLLSDKTSHGLEYNFAGFPYMGIWAAKDASFVCIEPWCGIADSENHDQTLETKEGIISLDRGGSLKKQWSIRCF